MIGGWWTLPRLIRSGGLYAEISAWEVCAEWVMAPMKGKILKSIPEDPSVYNDQ
jgi:hypothetical protein